MPAEPASVAEVLERVQIEWAALEYVVGGLSEAALTAPGPEVWSVKDHLAHIAEWERACTAVVQRRPQSEGFSLDPEAYREFELDPDSIDRLNDVLFQRHRQAPVSEVKSMAARAHAELLAALSHLTDAELQQPIGDFGMPSNPDRRVLEKVAADTYDHYAEHTTWIGELLSRLRGARPD